MNYPDDVIQTGVFATKEEIETLKRPIPMIVIGNSFPPTHAQLCHIMALAHGLPEVQGYYGIDLETGEFLTVR